MGCNLGNRPPRSISGGKTPSMRENPRGEAAFDVGMCKLVDRLFGCNLNLLWKQVQTSCVCEVHVVDTSICTCTCKNLITCTSPVHGTAYLARSKPRSPAWKIYTTLPGHQSNLILSPSMHRCLRTNPSILFAAQQDII
jgi:hypothetical protein